MAKMILTIEGDGLEDFMQGFEDAARTLGTIKAKQSRGNKAAAAANAKEPVPPAAQQSQPQVGPDGFPLPPGTSAPVSAPVNGQVTQAEMVETIVAAQQKLGNDRLRQIFAEQSWPNQVASMGPEYYAPVTTELRKVLDAN